MRSTPCARPPQPSTARRPGRHFKAWLHRFFVFFTSKRQVASELLKQSDGSNPFFGEGRPRVLAAGRPLFPPHSALTRSAEDLTLEQILDMVVAIAKIQGDSGYVEPILDAAFDGLRPTDDG